MWLLLVVLCVVFGCAALGASLHKLLHVNEGIAWALGGCLGIVALGEVLLR